MDIIKFESTLSYQEIFNKYKSYSIANLVTKIELYVKSISFEHNVEKESTTMRDYLPIGCFKINDLNCFYIDYLKNQCGLRYINTNFRYISDSESNNRIKLNIIIFIYVLKMIHDMKPEILILVSDIESSKSDVVFSYFSPPIYSGINPNSGHKINYYILNALNSNII